MDKLVAQLATAYDQELAICCDLVRTMIGDKNGRELLYLAEEVIKAMQEREGEEIEAATAQTVGVFARLGYLAAMNSLGELGLALHSSDEPQGADGADAS